MTIRVFAALLILVSVCGCASTPAYRDVARNTGTIVSNLHTGTAQFVTQQTALNADNAERLDNLSQHARRVSTLPRQQRLAWVAASGSEPSQMFDMATAPTAEAIVADIDNRAARPALVVAGNTATNYVKSRDALIRSAQEPDWDDILIGILAHADGIRTEYRTLREAAAESAAATTNAAVAADNATTGASTSASAVPGGQ